MQRALEAIAHSSRGLFPCLHPSFRIPKVADYVVEFVSTRRHMLAIRTTFLLHSLSKSTSSARGSNASINTLNTFSRCQRRYVRSSLRSNVMAASTSMPSQGVHQGRAILHDFCLVIPYGFALVLLGCIALATPGASKFGWLTGAVGLAQILLSSKSLGTWKVGGNHRVFTGLCLGLAALITYVAVSLYRMGAYSFVSLSTAALSGAMSLFLIHNLTAGGNKPPSQAKTE